MKYLVEYTCNFIDHYAIKTHFFSLLVTPHMKERFVGNMLSLMEKEKLDNKENAWTSQRNSNYKWIGKYVIIDGIRWKSLVENEIR